MIRINLLKLPIEHSEADIKEAINKVLKIKNDQLLSYEIVKRSLDARKKSEIKYIYSIDALVKEEARILKLCKNPNVSLSPSIEYQFSITGNEVMKHRPVVVGSGPAGLFCTYFLALSGYKPILIERGQAIEHRVKTVNSFWAGEKLNTESNVQFGEGGAGTFSDGKLNTMVKDPSGRIKKVLEIFAQFGAPSEICYVNKPHIGTDLLRNVVRNIREEIIRLGGEVLFETKLTDFKIENNKLTSILVEQTMNHENDYNNNEASSMGSKNVVTREIPCENLVLAVGHSARDTFELLLKRGLDLEKKSFAIGVRMEHKQDMIGKRQYGSMYDKLPPADYKVTHQCENGRGVYSFCMCPGGFVVDASSEENRLVVNGMSNHDRGEENANSALIVTVNPQDFLATPGVKDTPLAGMEFQRYYEELAYKAGRGKVPVQLFGDLLRNKESVTIGHIKPNIKGTYTLSNLRTCLPNYVIDSIVEGVKAFDQIIPGFAHEEAILSGVETRTSSPIRITRDSSYMSNIEGIYPCGEGAGYAGGIVSAAVDGIKVFEGLIQRFQP